VKRAVKE